jgi:hypothetical protein
MGLLVRKSADDDDFVCYDDGEERLRFESEMNRRRLRLLCYRCVSLMSSNSSNSPGFITHRLKRRRGVFP